MQTTPARRQQPQRVRQLLQDNALADRYVNITTQAIADMPAHNNLDGVMNACWQQCTDSAPKARRGGSYMPPTSSVGPQAVHEQIRRMRHLRQELRTVESSRSHQSIVSLQMVFRGWRMATDLQQVTREVRKAGRARKLQKVANIYRAAKILAPKAPRKRMQLRDKQGKIQTSKEEFDQIVQFFQELYSGPTSEHVTIDAPIHFSEKEVRQALHRLSTSKVMPTTSAPAALETDGVAGSQDP